MQQEHLTQPWKDLLRWLDSHSTDTTAFKATISFSDEGGRSLVATQDIEESTPILSLPPSVLLNTNTIPDQFIKSCSSDLTSTQTLTLFLSVYRSNQRTNDLGASGATSTNEPNFFLGFMPYLSSLPDQFPGIPMVWILQSIYDGEDTNDRPSGFRRTCATDRSKIDQLEHLLNLQTSSKNPSTLPYYQFMSITTIKKSNQVLHRFIQDWSALQVDILNLAPHLLLTDLVWAWLVVNTRCVWYDLGCQKHDDNITLAPAFDMANHSSKSAVTPIRTPNTLAMFSSYPIGTFNSPKTNQILESSKKKSDLIPNFMNNCLKSKRDEKIQIEKGDEITFTYGPHSNPTLFVEYGFIIESKSDLTDGDDDDDHVHDNPWDSIDISDQIQSLFSHLDHSSEKISILKRSGYWGDYVLQCQDSVEGSYRTLVALRLLHSEREDGIREWQEHIEGKLDELDPKVEHKVWKSLHQVLVDLLDHTKHLVYRIKNLLPSTHLDLVPYSRFCLELLAKNELRHLSLFMEQSKSLLSQFN